MSTEIHLDSLDLSEQLLVLSLRRTLNDDEADPSVTHAWRVGTHGRGEALHLFGALSRQIKRHARRRLRIHHPDSARLTLDEFCLLAFLTACQRGRTERSAALAQWLVRRPAHVALLGLGHSLASCMASAELELRGPDRFRPCPEPPRRTVVRAAVPLHSVSGGDSGARGGI